MITVTGATGRTGSKIATRLLHAGGPVRAVGRSAARLAELADAGAEPAAEVIARTLGGEKTR
jgi:uncharacterized protein YbjT (DUF2867 family)